MCDIYCLEYLMDERSRDLRRTIAMRQRQADLLRTDPAAEAPMVSGRALLMRNMIPMRRLHISRRGLRVGRVLISW